MSCSNPLTAVSERGGQLGNGSRGGSAQTAAPPVAITSASNPACQSRLCNL